MALLFWTLCGGWHRRLLRGVGRSTAFTERDEEAHSLLGRLRSLCEAFLHRTRRNVIERYLKHPGRRLQARKDQQSNILQSKEKDKTTLLGHSRPLFSNMS
ncbi:MAG: hypothetical protein ACUVQ8_00880 [Nitrososphaeria archaeon]